MRSSANGRSQNRSPVTSQLSTTSAIPAAGQGFLFTQPGTRLPERFDEGRHGRGGRGTDLAKRNGGAQSDVILLVLERFGKGRHGRGSRAADPRESHRGAAAYIPIRIIECFD